jgi:hypothetical protein
MLRSLIPGILIVSGLLNIGLRFLPPDYVALRSWEAVTMFVTSTGPFAPRKHYFNPAATGDLGTLANLPRYRTAHAELFSTGLHGYRDYEPGIDRAPAAIMFGDSFGAGASLSDSDYLCHVLEPVVGGPVVFGGYYYPSVADKLSALPKTRNVILQLSERYDLNDTQAAARQSPAGMVKRLVPAASRPYLALRYLKDLSRYSPLEIWSGRAYRYLQNDAVLPNPHAANVRRYTLLNNSEMLFLASETPHYLSPPPVNIASLVAVARDIESKGMHVMVLIVPNKFTVYYPLLRDVTPGPSDGELYVNVLERKLRAANVPVVNLTAPLRRAAAACLRSDKLIYRADDTHWNPSGVATAVETIRSSWPEIDNKAD